MNKEQLLTARLVTAAMKKFDAENEARAARGNEAQHSVAQKRLFASIKELRNASEAYKKSGFQP